MSQYSISDSLMQYKKNTLVDRLTGEIFDNKVISSIGSDSKGGGAPNLGGPLTQKGVSKLGGYPRGLSMGHISPFLGKMIIYKGGGLLKASRAPISKLRKGGGIRGKVTAFTKKSRWRFMQKIGTIQKAVLPIFITLTYPDDYANAKEEWAHHIDLLGKRFKRRGWSAIVRKEFVIRKSGENKGRIVPHYHLLVWGASLWDLRQYVPDAWYKIVKSGDNRHLQAGTRIEYLQSWRGVMSYVSKYMAKLSDDDLINEYPEGVGRFWSVINESGIPWAEIEQVNATDQEIIDIFRLMRRRINQKKARSSNRSMTILVDHPDQWRNLLL